MQNISFSNIVKLFNKNEWDFSYLTAIEMNEVLNFPVKLGNNLISDVNDHKIELKKSNNIFLIVIKKTKDFDYSLEPIFFKTINNNIPNLNLDIFHCNFKYAAVKAGLGQYARNSLFFHPKFNFETHIGVFICYSNLIDLPKRNIENFSLLSLCNNCNDCIKSCPVQAIHDNWIDMEKCDNFNFFGNHNYIPSIKYGAKQFYAPFLSDENLKKVTNFAEFKQATGKTIKNFVIINGEKIAVRYPTCRECTSQKKCSKYNGKYPYENSKVKILYE